MLPQAARDLDNIYKYISENLLVPDTAYNFIELLENEILSLENMPYRCSERKVGRYANKGYRELFVKNYVIIYRISEIDKSVIIVTVKYIRTLF